MVRYAVAFLMIAAMQGAAPPELSSAAGGGVDVSPASGETAPAAASPSAQESAEDKYLIGPGDVLDISVWKDEALTRSCVVRPDGAISFPLIGNVKAAGRTASRIKAEIEQKLERYVPGAVLSLEVKQVNSLIVYVIGKVNAPGRYVMNTNVDVLQALATAGGLNVYAKRNQIKVFRQGPDATTIFPFEYDEIVEGRRLDQNIMLNRGDVVVVP
jgi:polysaccharide export outer membrane protein